jgi:acetylornithine deacetylase
VSGRAIDPIELLEALLAAKSYSGQEGPAADVVVQALTGAGLRAQRIEHSVIAQRGTGARTLLLNSHLDTVPASDKWTRDPWTPAIDGDRLYGLGATDAKSCVAAMVAALSRVDPGERGRLVVTATTEEETGGGDHPNGMEVTLPTLGAVHGAIVGEPTQLNICNGQRGMLRLNVHVHGQAGHASRPWEGVNAIEQAAPVIADLKVLAAKVADEGRDAIGVPTLQPTLMAAGTAKNVIPDHAVITLDVRTTTGLDNARFLRAIRETVGDRAEIEVISARFRPVATPMDSAIVGAAQRVLPEAELRGFGGVSDLFFLTTIPPVPVECCLVGPGDGRQSHQPDEFVSVTMVRKAADAYAAIAEHFLGLGGDGH